MAWDLAGARAVLPSLFGHLFYGPSSPWSSCCCAATTGRGCGRGSTPVFRGALAGLVVSAVLVPGPRRHGRCALGWLFLGACFAGLGYPLLFGAARNEHRPGPGPGHRLRLPLLVVAASPCAAAATGRWTGRPAACAQRRPAAGLRVARRRHRVLFTGLGAAARRLFVDDVRVPPRRVTRRRGLRATGYGALAGVAGGLVFTVVMVLVERTADRGGPGRRPLGRRRLVVHLVIAQIIGVSYAVLFRRRSFDLASGIGWGVSYGFFWWVLGDLTLLPVLTGGPPHWSAAGIAAEFPSLVGHLAYGAALGAVYYRLETRTNPWWFSRSTAEAERVAAQRDQTLGSAPALWALIVMLALTIPVLLSG